MRQHYGGRNRKAQKQAGAANVERCEVLVLAPAWGIGGAVAGSRQVRREEQTAPENMSGVAAAEGQVLAAGGERGKLSQGQKLQSRENSCH